MHSAFMPKRTDADRARIAFRRFMNGRGLEPAEWCRRARIRSSSTVYNFLRGDTQSLTHATLEKLAKAEGVTVSELTGETPAPTSKNVLTTFVRGAVEAGAWREAVEWPEDEWIPISVPRDEKLPESAFALLVKGPSMNLEYAEGSYVICVPVDDYAGEIAQGEHVVFCRRNRSGLSEATLKELRFDGQGRAWLWPRSSEPAHATPIAIPWPPDKMASENHDGTEELEITAVVVGSYRPRRRG